MRELARGQYSAQDVETQLRADNAVFSIRFDLVDRSYGVVDRLDVLGAAVDWDADRAIPRSLTLQMLPRSDLLNVPFKYLGKPYWLLKMDNVDGGYAEFPMGAYPFTIPERLVVEAGALGSGSSDTAGDNEESANPETWTLTLGDQMHYLEAAGVGPQGFSVSAGTELVDGLAALLSRNGLSDVSGITASDAVASQTLSWTLDRGAEATSWQAVFIPGPGPFGATMSPYGVWYTRYGWQQVRTALKEQTTAWADVAAELHAQLGYSPPGFDLDFDRYIARPAPDLAALSGVGVIEYEPGQNSLLQPGVQITPNLSALGNRATVIQSSATAGLNDVAVVDLNDLIPGHPLSQGKTGFYMELSESSPGGVNALQMQAQAKRMLFDAVRSLESVRITTLANPAHDAWEIVSLRVPGDPIFDTAQFCSEQHWSWDLFTGKMTHELRRLGIPAVTAVVIP